MSRLPVVLPHGLRVTGRVWDPQARALAAERPVSAPDLPGHGTRADRPFTADAVADVVAAEIDSLSGRALLAGISMGGYASIIAAARYPERIAGLVPIGCTMLPAATRTLPYRALSRLGGHGGEGVQRWLFRRMLGEDGARAIISGGLYTTAIPDVLRVLSRFDPLGALSSYPGRVHLVNGSRDHLRVNERRFLAACRRGA